VALYKYNFERIHTRMNYIQYLFTHKNHRSLFDSFLFPIVVYDRDGTIAAANNMFRDFTGINEDDIQLKKVNIFDYIENENDGLEEAVRMAFSGTPNVYISDARILHAETDAPEDFMIQNYPNAIFYPMTYEQGRVKLVGILLDDNKTAEGETID